MKKNVLDWLEETANSYSEKIAYESAEKAITFNEVMNFSKKIGSMLIDVNNSTKPIAVFLGKDISTIYTFFGVVYSGRAYAPLDTTLPEARIVKILQTLQPDIVITDENNIEKISGYCKKINEGIIILTVDNLLDASIDENKLSYVRNNMVETDPLYIIFTSGSSGIPKGVVTSHHSLMCYIQAYTEMMKIDETDRLGNQSPLDYIAAIRDIYIPIYKGAYSYLIPKNYFMQPEKLSNLLNSKNISTLGWSTSAITVLTSLGILDNDELNTIRKVCFSGSVMPGAVLRKWQEKYPDISFVNQYGPTEATASCTYYLIDHIVDEDENIPIGIPYNNYKIYLINEDGKLVNNGELGEICVSGPSLALGYYNNLEKTHADFTQNPLNNKYEERIYWTGDLGRYREDGMLEFRGRKDRQIKHMGHRVEMDEIESAAMSIDNIDECAVLYDYERESLCLFYTGKSTTRDITVQLRKSLPGFMIPRKIINLQQIPKLPNGKVDMVTLKKEL